MLIIKKINQLNAHITKLKQEGKYIGFVPTMGALHAGHISLINYSKEENQITVCSIFVNPTQFNDPNDFKKYPITIAADIEKLESAGCDILFLPDVEEMYPNQNFNSEKIDFGFIGNTLEGEKRPGHYDGVAQVVEKLVLAVVPHKMYMGQKDYQQVLIVEKMLENRKIPVEVIMCPILREADGLAMSSRNVRLDAISRANALALSQTLYQCKSAYEAKMLDNSFVSNCIKELEKMGIGVEYMEIRAQHTLLPVTNFLEKDLIILIAANVGGVRLIDNMIL